MVFKSAISRNQKAIVYRMGRKGCTLAQIVDAIDGVVSKQRVMQILAAKRVKPLRVRQRKLDQADAVRKDAYISKWGFAPDERIAAKDAKYRVMRNTYNNKHRNAKAVGIEFTIPFGEIEFPDVCPVLGIPLVYGGRQHQDNCATYDRLEPSKGYVSGNVNIISYRANRLKFNGTLAEIRAVADWMESKI
jgi:hypothetical protein